MSNVRIHTENMQILRAHKATGGQSIEFLVNQAITQIYAKKSRTDKKPDSDNLSEVWKIIHYLNGKTGSKFSAKSTKTQSLISARIKEGRTVEDFKTVIDKKVDDWANDQRMCKYLRPETLFGTKFEGYLNEQSGQPDYNGFIYGDSEVIDGQYSRD